MNEILQNELFDAFANAAENVYLFVCDMETDMSRWSKNAVDYFDLPGEYLKNAGMVWLDHLYPDDQDFYLSDISAVFSGKSTHHYCQYRAQNRYGDYVWVECHGSVIPGTDSFPKIFAGMITRLDIQNKYDPLTSLLSYYEFQKYDFHNHQGTILLLGLDDFRQLINHYGYDYGDRILAEFAGRLKKLTPEGHLVYRYQEEEFLIITPDGTEEKARELAKRIFEFCQDLGVKAGHPINITISTGIALYPKDGGFHEELLECLKCVHQYAREQKHSGPVFFSPEITKRHNRIFQLRESLTESIQNDFEGFSLYYQPVIDGRTHQISGCEALLRWESAEISDASPLEVIKSLESTGEISRVGDWVMEQVFRKAKKWQKRYGIILGFNASCLQFTDDTFVNRIIAEANRQNIDTHHIIIELTETSAVSTPSALSSHFKTLRENGFCIALDDFGTTNSALGLLELLPADLIKIDHRFVRELNFESTHTDMSIIKSVVSICNKRSIGVVVEGIETKKIEDIFLDLNLNINLLQGYLYSKPVNESDLERILERGYLSL